MTLNQNQDCITKEQLQEFDKPQKAHTFRKITTTTLIGSALLASACNHKAPERDILENSDITTTDLAIADVATAEIAKTDDDSAENQLSSRIVNPGARVRSIKSDSLAYELTPYSFNNETYAALKQNNTVVTREQAVSTFSVDVDTGSYSNVRRFLENGQLPPADAVRVEELLNYFDYDYKGYDNVPVQSENQPFSVFTETGPNPWNSNTRLLHIGLQSFTPADVDMQPANLVFLVDVSGSMNNSNKLGLLKSSISLLVEQLDDKDTVSIVVYAGSSGVALEPTPGNEHRQIRRALSRLTAGGSTNGAQGIELAYQLAIDNFKKDGANRIILATDGDFNVGTSDIPSLLNIISQKRDSGVALTTLGFGMGNYNDHLMEQLADAGDGNYAYIDTLGEARKVLVDELTATITTIARDVKIQIEFNPATVAEYRLIGYTNRQLNNEDFRDDKVDAGEIGAGHSVTALYEIALVNEDGERHTPSRYNIRQQTSDNRFNNELAAIRLRYKLPGKKNSDAFEQVIELPARQQLIAESSNSFRFSASVAAFGQLLSNDTRINNFSYADAHELASSAVTADPFGYRAEYLRLLDLAKSLNDITRASTNSDDSQG